MFDICIWTTFRTSKVSHGSINHINNMIDTSVLLSATATVNGWTYYVM